MCSFLTSNIVLKIILYALFEFKSKDKYERKMLNRLKRNFRGKIPEVTLLKGTLMQI